MAEKIKVTFLGTGSAVPTSRRNHPAVFVQYKDEGILFDCGEGTQRQFRKAGISPTKIKRIFLSHWHGDHVLGLPGLFQTLMLLKIEEKIEIYGPRGTRDLLALYSKLFLRKGNFVKLALDVFEVEKGVVFDGGEFCVESVPADHDVLTNSYAFVVKEKTRLDREKLKKFNLPNSPIVGKLARGEKVVFDGKEIDGSKLIYKEPERRVAFVIDTRFCKQLVEISRGAELLISESTFSADEKNLAEERAHMTSEDAARLAKEANVKRLALIHLSQRHDEMPKKILGEARKIFKNVFLPEDLDSVEI
ncbi:ribonuclease Z [Candidatus Pacearchaeota archaeon]|nr:MAG: ribonuclease Z [Candidatus Pacearchaeota archaeon]